MPCGQVQIKVLTGHRHFQRVAVFQAAVNLGTVFIHQIGFFQGFATDEGCQAVGFENGHRGYIGRVKLDRQEAFIPSRQIASRILTLDFQLVGVPMHQTSQHAGHIIAIGVVSHGPGVIAFA